MAAGKVTIGLGPQNVGAGTSSVTLYDEGRDTLEVALFAHIGPQGTPYGEMPTHVELFRETLTLADAQRGKRVVCFNGYFEGQSSMTEPLEVKFTLQRGMQTFVYPGSQNDYVSLTKEVNVYVSELDQSNYVDIVRLVAN